MSLLYQYSDQADSVAPGRALNRKRNWLVALQKSSTKRLVLTIRHHVRSAGPAVLGHGLQFEAWLSPLTIYLAFHPGVYHDERPFGPARLVLCDSVCRNLQPMLVYMCRRLIGDSHLRANSPGLRCPTCRQAY